jgi:NAD(P)-dependent dehydrogenase (short-subunit alcohol dehydrogenase family)
MIAEIAAAGGRAIAVAADVAEVARTEAELGPVTILVNNAGVTWRGTLDTYDPESSQSLHLAFSKRAPSA